MESKIKLIITARERDLGGFNVRRLLPFASHRMVGPFIFFDHMGPASFSPGNGMDVRPHPHINLATVTYLFEGKIEHRDSLGSYQVIEPGAINWMTAGKGIVHSERTPPDLRKNGFSLNGIQLWVALPEEKEEVKPSFIHHPKETLPEFKLEDVKIKVLLGSILGHTSPVSVESDLFYAEVQMPKGSHLKILAENRESAAYVVNGKIQIETDTAEILPYSMAVIKDNQDFIIHAIEDSKVMLLGGSSLGPRYIYWNFISSSQERIEKAKKEWLKGPLSTNLRFFPIPDDHEEFIPLPKD